MAVTSTLAVTAFQARNEAREQRREAEGLVDFMVGDLKDKLEPIGTPRRARRRRPAGARLLSASRIRLSSPTLRLLQRSRALSLMAKSPICGAISDGATRLYREAMAGTAEAVRRNPEDPQRLFDHAQNVFWIGDLARQQGQISEAESSYREYKRLADQMVARQPDNLKWRMEVLYATEDIGITLKLQRRYAEAAQLFGSTLDPMLSLATVDPDNSVYQQEFSNLLGWFADTESALGHLDSAIAARRRQIAFLERVVANGKTAVGLRKRLIPSHEGLGLLFAARGRIDEAIAEDGSALTQADGLLAIEPTNSEWRDLAASVDLDLARNLFATGNTAKAAEATAGGCAFAESLRSHDSNVARWRGLWTTCLSMRSRVALASGAMGPALTFASQALDAARSRRSGDPVTDRYLAASAYRLLGDVYQHMGNQEQSRTAWSEGLAEIPQNVAEQPQELDEHAELLERLGRTQEAAPLKARLGTIGYKRVI